MPAFTTSREFKHEKTIPASREEVIALLQNPQELCSLGPLFKSLVKDEKEEHTYWITDRLPILGPIEGSTTFKAKLLPTSDGVTTDVSAALGTKLKTKYWVEGKTDGSCVVKENTVVEAPFVTMPPNAAAKSEMPYGLWHLSLNKLPGESDEELPKTEWLNMGYWKGATTFPDACRALALKVIAAARLKPGDNVLDVGFGTGECLVVLLSDPSVPRPSKLSGITNDSLHCQRTERRLDELQQQQKGSSDSSPVPVKLCTGDAVWDGHTSNHPFHPSSSDPFDAILATDCAYHFHTRQKFMSQAFASLRPGGRLALADICFSPTALGTWYSRIVTSVVRLMPLENRISVEGLAQQMRGDIGFDDVVYEDITQEVFPHFVPFLKSRGGGWWLFALVLQLYTSSGARFVVISGRRPS